MLSVKLRALENAVSRHVVQAAIVVFTLVRRARHADGACVVQAAQAFVLKPAICAAWDIAHDESLLSGIAHTKFCKCFELEIRISMCAVSKIYRGSFRNERIAHKISSLLKPVFTAFEPTI